MGRRWGEDRGTDQAHGHFAIRVPRGGAGADLTGTKNPVPIILTIDDDSGTTSVKATNFVAALE
jgi:hypothetical protein